MSRVALARLLTAPEEWDRRKLQVLLGLALLVVAGVVVGIVLSVQSLLGGGNGTTQDLVDGRPAKDEIAKAGLPAVTLEDAQPGPLSKGTASTLAIPQPARLGEAQVATGFPRTTEGALAQLIAIDQRALESVSVVTAQHVIESWALPGGPTPQTWSGVEAVTVLLSSAGLPAHGTTNLQVELHPAMGFIREVSDHVVVPCVDFVVTLNAGTAPTSRIAVADCQRMVWKADRWLIGAGSEPAMSPSLWPGTQASYEAGYRWLEVAP